MRSGRPKGGKNKPGSLTGGNKPYHERADWKMRPLPISTEDFQPVGEAKPFVSMYRRGVMTEEQVKDLLLMTDEQKQELVEDGCGERSVLDVLQAKRCKTWQTFKAMIAQPVAALVQ